MKTLIVNAMKKPKIAVELVIGIFFVLIIVLMILVKVLFL